MNLRKALAAAVATTLVAGSALASTTWLAGPSILDVSQSGAFTGGGFPAAATVQVRIQSEGGVATQNSAVVGADGNLVVEVTPPASGSYTVTVLDLAGTDLATVSFICP